MSSDTSPGVLSAHEVTEMRGDIREIRKDMGQIAAAITRIAVLEERHTVFVASMERVVNKLDKLEEKQRESDFHRDTMSRIFDRVELVEKKANDVETKLAAYENRGKGAAFVVKVMWAVFGGSILVIAGGVLKFIFQ